MIKLIYLKEERNKLKVALLELKDIGKIYVSDNNVAVGIRGVNLSFDKGEFVAVTGQSGSGKSTLLNVISGMDTYEEGELYIEGQTTSHYMQPDWEQYRQKYISFIFQDYNIIDSFTVLQNVELALMHIEDKKERRARALELLERVGMTSHIKQRGSKLSGGQKQRTVIARALAKDSPIILADEPTGNLDSATSAEIISLLREVSRDKLLIIVTHNFEEVSEYATRHVRIFDGAVESDRVLINDTKNETQHTSVAKQKENKKTDFKNGITLGRSVFTSRPRLSAFLCLLLTVGALGIFFVSSLCGEAMTMFDKNYMFTPIEGRVVLTRRDGAVMSESELSELAKAHGATDVLHYDSLLDNPNARFMISGMDMYSYFDCTYIAGDTSGMIGRMPQSDNEVLMSVPISYKKYFGSEPDSFGDVYMQSMKLKVVGVNYYVDNNIKPQCVFTRQGFEIATGVYYLTTNRTSVTLSLVSPEGKKLQQGSFGDVMPSYDVEKGKVYADGFSAKEGYGRELSMVSEYYTFNQNMSDDQNHLSFSKSFKEADFSDTPIEDMYVPMPYGGRRSHMIAVSPYAMSEMANDVLSRSYRQASLFFEDDESAEAAILALRNEGYIAVSSYETYKPDAMSAMATIVESVMYILVWGLAIIFLAFFINLCSSRTIGAFKSDMAIMRSMGISVRTIRVGMYVRMLLALIPALLAVVAVAVLIFTIPSVNAFFSYLYAWQYLLIFLGMLLLTLRVTQKQVKRLFSESVKKALKGGAAND